MLKFLNAPNRGANFGCVDLILGYFVIATPFTMFVSPESFFAGLILSVVFLTIWLWRRGWIAHWREQKKVQEQQEIISQRQQEIERQQATSIDTNTSTNNTNTTTSVTERQTSAGEIFEVAVVKDTEWSSTQAFGFMQSLITKFNSLLELSIVATKGAITWQIIPYGEADISREVIENLAQTYYPNASVTLQPFADFDVKLYRKYHIFEAQYQIDFQSAKSVHSIKSEDPLTSVVQAIGNLRDKEQMRYSLILQTPFQLSQEEVFENLTVPARDVVNPGFSGLDFKSDASFAGSLVGGLLKRGIDEVSLRTQRVDRFSPEDTKRFGEKLTQPLMVTTIALMFNSPEKERLSALDDAISSVFALSSGEEITINRGYTSKILEITSLTDWFNKHPIDYLAAISPQKEGEPDGTAPYRFVFTVEEAATLWHVPHKKMNVSEITWANQVPDKLTPSDTTGRLIIGNAASKTVSLLPRDLRYHAFISGQTGTGKSNLLHNLTHQLMQSDQGFAIFDPHGTLIRDIIQTSPTDNKKVLLLDLNNTDYPIPLNPFRVPDGVDAKSAFNLSLWIMKTVYKKSWSEGRMETVVRNTLELVLTDPEATPLDMQRVLRNNNYRQKRFNDALKAGLLSTSSEMWWEDDYNRGSDHQRTEASRPVINRLRTFLDAGIEPMVCHPNGLDFRDLIANGYKLLINLHGNNVRSEIGSLGAILFAQIYLNSISLGEHPSTKSPRFYMIIDETHRFITTQFQDMLSEARKFGLSLIMADQWLGQLDSDTRKAIVNNRGTTISFAASEEEAPTMAALYEPYVSVSDLINQSVGEASIRTRHEGTTLPAFKLKTLAPLKKPSDDEKDEALKKKDADDKWEQIWQRTIEELELIPAHEVKQWIRTRYRSKSADAESTGETGEQATDIDYGESSD